MENFINQDFWNKMIDRKRLKKLANKTSAKISENNFENPFKDFVKKPKRNYKNNNS